MIGNENWSARSSGVLRISRGVLIFALAGMFSVTGCSTLKKLTRGSEESAPPAEVASKGPQPADRIARLESRNRDLEREVRDLKVQLDSEKSARDSLMRRLEASQAAREDAVREVVRMRARIQGMASQAEASAMFAEARVILDRMGEEAFSTEALEDLNLAVSYMKEGKNALDTGNPGGAAYLFDLITGLYERMGETSPRRVTVNVSAATLRASPSSTSAKTDILYWGESATGIGKKGNWVKVKTSSGVSGWLMKSQIR